MKMNSMEAQLYFANSNTWFSWCESDNPHAMSRKKRPRLENSNLQNSVKYSNEPEQTWTNVEQLTGEFPTVQLDSLEVETQENFIDEEFLVFDPYHNFKQEISNLPNSVENNTLNQFSGAISSTKNFGNPDTSKPECSKLFAVTSSTQQRYSTNEYINSPNNDSSSSCSSVSSSDGKNSPEGDIQPLKDCPVSSKNNGNCNAEKHAEIPATSLAFQSSLGLDDSFRFQYVLCAATSTAMKINEETLTYLNQGQPYEIKLKKLGDLTHVRGKIFKSIIRVLFHDRRLQYSERQQMSAWQASRPGDRILQLDLPLSYGIFDHLQDSNALNAVQFLWDPTKDVGVYIKVNCISTEFTAKKHGGEKGVPFRIQIETYSYEKNPKSLHMASCQIKVFKLKGADRKHKQDREKIMKKTAMERKNFQNSYESTVFTDMYLNGDPMSPCGTVNSSVNSSPRNTDSDGGLTNGSVGFDYDSNGNEQSGTESNSQGDYVFLTRESSTADMQSWLRFNRFGSHISRFENFTVNDMLSLSREDCIQISGISDGIRLFNTLPIVSKLTMYISTDNHSNIYHPVYLKTLTCQELIGKVAPLIGLSASQVHSGFMLGPHNSQIIITDDLVRNIKEETLFSAESSKDGKSRGKLLFKPMSTPTL